MQKTELSSVALGGRIVAVSDEFFAEAFHLLLVEVSSIIGSRGSWCAQGKWPMSACSKHERPIRTQRCFV